MKKHLFLTLLLLASLGLAAQKTDLKQMMQQRNEYYFTFNLNGNDDLSTIARTISVDRVDGTTVTAYANNREFAEFQKLGYEVTLQTPPSMKEEVAMWDGSNRAAYDWDSYPTYQAYEDMMFAFQTNHPDKCEIITLGTLPSNRKIMVAHINNGSGEGKPKFLYTSTIHGDETTGWILMLRLIDYLLENPTLAECQNVLNNIDLYIAPNTNPDGTYHGGNNSVNGATRYNANGVDMNRNYPDPHSSQHPDGNPFAQETQWFMQFAQDNNFVMGANYHGGAEVMNYPWDNTYTLHADDAWYQLISHEYADLTHQVNSNYMDDYNNGVTNGAQWYMIGGGRQDYMNGYAQCRELTIECSNTKLPGASQLPSFWNYNKNSIFAFMNQCLYGIHGTVTDAANGAPLEATITITGHDDEYSVVNSGMEGDFHRPIKAGTYTLTFTASGYHPHQETVTVGDYERVNLNVQLEAGEGILPDFIADPVDVTLHGSVNFTDQTWGANLVSWQWVFEGGEPSTSNQRNPQGITYNTIGHYNVTLTVTNSSGQTESITKQNYINVSESYNMQDATIVTCNALFYDNGGPNDNYSDQKNYTMTFKPVTPGAMIEVDFTSFSLENNYDYLNIYDGSSISGPQIGAYTGNNSPGTVTATNEEGALTFRFISDYSVNNSGWSAVVRCVGGDTEPLEVDATAEPAVINEGETSELFAYVTGGSGDYSFEWEPAEYLDYPHVANPIASPVLPLTEFTVTVTDSEGNTARAYVTVEIRNVSISENSLDKVTVFPNPTRGNFTVRGITGNTDYCLTNDLGQTVVAGSAKRDFLIDKELTQGLYILRLSNDTQVTTMKIIVK